MSDNQYISRNSSKIHYYSWIDIYALKPLVLAGNNENVLFMTTPGTICCQTDTYGSLLFQFVVKNDSIESINISKVLKIKITRLL